MTNFTRTDDAAPSWWQQQVSFIALALALFLSWPGTARPAGEPGSPAQIGIVVMHGKGGTPTRYVDGLASYLAGQGFQVANLDMPWSGRRDYDVSVDAGLTEVQNALDALRAKGATTMFVAGHSQGGLFAMVFGARRPVDGVIAIAPGAYADGPTYRDKLGESLSRAKDLIAEGKGDEKARFFDFESSRGLYPIIVTPNNYLSWFNPDGAITIEGSLKKLPPTIPVLFVVPTNDYPPLRKAKDMLFAMLPANPNTRLYEPGADHLGAPWASREEIAQWVTQIGRGQAAK
jgi:pimeloyl-ACP methyl ester carboxylesterase